MAQIRLSIGQVNITGHLIVRARKTITPLAVEAQESYPPPQPANRNVVVPAVGDIDAGMYYIDFYESPDGSALGLLLAQFQFELTSEDILLEPIFYKAGGGDPEDPIVGGTQIVDSYLDGKTIYQVYKEGFRPMVPPTYSYKEYDLIVGGGIELLNGVVFGNGEVIVIVLSHKVQNSGGASVVGLYNGIITLTADTTLNSTHRRMGLKCASNASARQVHTLESVAIVPAGTFYHFYQNDGNQYQTKIVTQPGETITYFDTVYTEMTIGPGEYLRIEKVGTIWEATMVHPNVLMVGEQLTATWKSHPNCKPEDGALYDGDDWPRPYDFVKNKLPVSHKVIDDAVINPGYVHPVGKEGMWVIHSTQKKFRVPNTQGWSQRGLADFNTYGADATRTHDFPGGSQSENVGAHRHFGFFDNGTNNTGTPLSGTNKPVKRQGNGTGIGNANSEYNITGGADEPNVGLTSSTAGENRVKNIGVIYLRRF